MISGKDFLKLADSWIRGSTEAEWRSAVSRAYYAVFHEARRLLRDLGFRVPRADQAHAYLWMRLANCGDSRLQMAGNDLNTLRRERNRADYDIEKSFDQAQARLQIQAGRRIIQTLDAAHIEPTRTRITDTMKVYERDTLKQTTWGP